MQRRERAEWESLLWWCHTSCVRGGYHRGGGEMRKRRCDCGLRGRRIWREDGAGGHDARECRCECRREGGGGRCCPRLGWYGQRLGSGRCSSESAAVEDPDTDKAVRAARAREAHVIEEFNVVRKCVRAGQGHDIELAAPLAASRTPREYQPVATVQSDRIAGLAEGRTNVKGLHALFVDKERLEHLEHGHVRV